MTLINFVIYFVTIVTNSLLGFFVYFRNPHSNANKQYIYFTHALVAWILTLFLYYFISDPYWVTILGKINFACALFIPFFFHRFVYEFPEKSVYVSPKLKNFMNAFVVSIVCITLFTPLVDKEELVHGAERSTVFGELYSLYIVGMLVPTIASIVLLIAKFRKARGIVKAQLQYLILAFILFMLLGCTTNIFLPYFFNIYYLQPFGPLSTVVLLGFITYAMVKHRLLDIRVVIVRSVAYTFLIAVLASIYTLGVFFISRFIIHGENLSEQRFTYALLAVFVVLTFEPIKNLLQQATDRVFFRGKYNSPELILNLTTLIASTFKLKDLTQRTLHEILTTLQIDHGAFFIYRKKNKFTISADGYKRAPNFRKDALNKLHTIKRMVLVDEEKEKSVKQLMQQLGSSIAVPLSERGNIEGFLLLGNKKSGGIYTPQDIKILEIFGPMISLAIQNAKSYEEIKSFNKTLSDKVAYATKELQVSHVKLQTLDKQKDKFLGMASHELKTPITSIKAFTQVLYRKINREEHKEYSSLLENINTQTDKVTNLINDLLNVSNIEEGKLVLKRDTFSIDELVAKTVSDTRYITDTHKITIKGSVGSPIYGDADRLAQVLSNLLTNAIKYSPTADKIIVHLAKRHGFIDVSVQDFGPGIAKEDQEKIFDRFYRTQDHEEKNIAGFGLGLYISAEIIKRHNGKISVESTKGKGATFTFTLPINKN